MIELRLLGGFRLSASDGRPVERLTQRPRRAALLAWLAAVRPYGLQRRDKALVTFWPELDERHARGALSQSLYVLRDVLGDDAILARGHDEIGIDRRIVWCDVAAFEAAFADGRYADALALYTGDLLDGFHSADALGFEWWLDDARAQLRTPAAEAAWALADTAAERADVESAKRWAARAAALQPGDDTAIRRLMTLLHRVGDRTAAILAYETFARDLEREYELEPAAETQALALALRDHATDPAAIQIDLPRAPQTRARPRASRARRAAAAAVLMAAAVLATPMLLAVRGEPPAADPVQRFSLDHAVSPGHPGSTIALSPQGDRLIYIGFDAGGTKLYLRPLDRLEAEPIPHTAGADVPFFSPDGEWVGFIVGSRIRRVRLDGTQPLDVLDTGASVRGATWTDADDIVFTNAAGLWSVPSAGGRPRLIAATDPGNGPRYGWPAALPRGTHAAVTRFDTAGSRIVFVTLKDGTVTDPGINGTAPRFVTPDLLLFARSDGTLFATRLDLRTLQRQGSARRIATGVTVGVTGAAKLGVSQGGTLAYVPGSQNHVLTYVDRSGRQTPLAVAPDGFTNARLSPDGRFLATTIGPSASRTDAWLVDLGSGSMRRLTFDSMSVTPAWSSDGTALFVATHAGVGRGFGLRRIPVAQPDSATWLLAPSRGQLPAAATPDGRALIFHRNDPRTRGDIWMVDLNGHGEPVPILASPADERGATLSPAGDQLAYVSTESGQDEVYLRPFPGPGDAVQISSGGGNEPRWDPAGTTLFYRGDGGMIAASLSMSPLRVLSTTLLFAADEYIGSRVHAIYDVLPEGDRFIMLRRAPGNHDLIVVMNALEEGVAR